MYIYNFVKNSIKNLYGYHLKKLIILKIYI